VDGERSPVLIAGWVLAAAALSAPVRAQASCAPTKRRETRTPKHEGSAPSTHAKLRAASCATTKNGKETGASCKGHTGARALKGGPAGKPQGWHGDAVPYKEKPDLKHKNIRVRTPVGGRVRMVPSNGRGDPGAATKASPSRLTSSLGPGREATTPDGAPGRGAMTWLALWCLDGCAASHAFGR